MTLTIESGLKKLMVWATEVAMGRYIVKEDFTECSMTGTGKKFRTNIKQAMWANYHYLVDTCMSYRFEPGPVDGVDKAVFRIYPLRERPVSHPWYMEPEMIPVWMDVFRHVCHTEWTCYMPPSAPKTKKKRHPRERSLLARELMKLSM